MTLTEFLLARIADDEDLIRMAAAGGIARMEDGVIEVLPQVFRGRGLHKRLKAECDAKRGIIARVDYMVDEPDGLGTLCEGVLLNMASVYVDHPDYDIEAWTAS